MPSSPRRFTFIYPRQSSNASTVASTHPSAPNLTCNIPDDILFDIFLLMVQDEALYMLDKSTYYPASPQYPWTLAEVCRRWRRVCLESPRLWSYLNFAWHQCPGTTGVDLDNESVDPYILRTELLLERSRNTPLFINAGILCDCDQQRLHWQAVFAHSSRWKEAYIGYSEYDEKFVDEMLPSNSGFGQLRRLTILKNDLDCEGDPYVIVPFPADCSSLFSNILSLTLQFVQDLTPPLEEFPWNRLTCLSIAEYTGLMTDILTTLSHCTSLLHSDISLHEDNRGMDAEDIGYDIEKDSVVLSHLVSLTLADCHLIAFNLLPFLRLPSLRCLKINNIDASKDGRGSHDTLIEFLTRSSRSLEELDLHWYGSEKDLRRLLRLTPSARCITFNGDVHRLLKVLSENGSSSRLCPHLEQVKVRYYPHKYGIAELRNMVQSRMVLGHPRSTPLKSLRIFDTMLTDWYEFLPHCMLVKECLQDYIDNGLELMFFSPKQRYQWSGVKAEFLDPDDYEVVPKMSRLCCFYYWVAPYPLRVHHDDAPRACDSFSKLSDDIVFEIFLSMVQEEALSIMDHSDYDPSSDPRSKPPNYPWIFVAVCKRWRAIYLETRGMMWSYINFSWHRCDTDKPEHMDRSLFRTQLQLERSGDALLCIDAGLLCGCPKRRLHWKVIFAHSSRWMDVRLGYDEEDPFVKAELIPGAAGANFKNVRKLMILKTDLVFREYGELPFPAAFNDSFSSISSLTLQHVVDMLPLATFPWRCLTCLSFEDFCGGLISQVLTCLAHCTNLLHVDIHVSDNILIEAIDTIARHVRNDSVVLPKLLSSTLADGYPRVTNLLPFLRLPSLRLPSLRCLKIYNTDANDIVYDFLARSSCPLTALDLHCQTEEDLRGLLLLAPKLRSLTFSGDSHQLVRLLCEREDASSPPTFSPSLEHLKLYHDPLELGPELKALIESRSTTTNSSMPMKSLQIVDDSWNKWDEFLEHYALVQEGLRTSIDNGLELKFLFSEHFYDGTICPDSDPEFLDPEHFAVVPNMDRLHRESYLLSPFQVLHSS